jgi:hypothetical protein
MILYCWFEFCLNQVEVDEPTAWYTRYYCREHVRKDVEGIHFQDCQFDREIGSGVDPKAYERGSYSHSSHGSSSRRSSSTRQQRDEKNEESLIGHENAEEILKILKTDVRSK